MFVCLFFNEKWIFGNWVVKTKTNCFSRWSVRVVLISIAIGKKHKQSQFEGSFVFVEFAIRKSMQRCFDDFIRNKRIWGFLGLAKIILALNQRLLLKKLIYVQCSGMFCTVFEAIVNVTQLYLGPIIKYLYNQFQNYNLILNRLNIIWW